VLRAKDTAVSSVPATVKVLDYVVLQYSHTGMRDMQMVGAPTHDEQIDGYRG